MTKQEAAAIIGNAQHETRIKRRCCPECLADEGTMHADDCALMRAQFRAIFQVAPLPDFSHLPPPPIDLKSKVDIRGEQIVCDLQSLTPEATEIGWHPIWERPMPGRNVIYRCDDNMQRKSWKYG